MSNQSHFLTKSERTVLSCLLEYGPDYGFSIFKTLQKGPKKLSDKSIYISLKTLTEKNMLEIEVVASKKKNRGRGRPVEKKYSLTLFGLCMASSTIFDSEKEVERLFDKIIENWNSLLPFLFGRWETIKSYNLNYFSKNWLFASMLDHACIGISECYSPHLEWYVNEVSIVFDFIFHMIDTFDRPFSYNTLYDVNVAPFLRADKEFKEILGECIEIILLDSKYSMAWQEERKKLFESLPDLYEYKLARDSEEEGLKLLEALNACSISYDQFSKLKALHAVWKMQSGQILYDSLLKVKTEDRDIVTKWLP